MKAVAYFGKQESVMTAGFLVLLMMWHHLFNAPHWLLPGVGYHTCFGYPAVTLTEKFAAFGNICVQGFAIISGYTLWVKLNAYATLRFRMERLVRFLGAYWLVCLLFLTVGYISDAELPSFWMLTNNLVGLYTGPGSCVNVPFAWYVNFYIWFLLLAPGLVFMFSCRSVWADISAFILILSFIEFKGMFDSSLFQRITSYFEPFSASAFGILTAKYHLFERCGHHLRLIPLWGLFLCIIVLAYTRFYLGSISCHYVLGGVIY